MSHKISSSVPNQHRHVRVSRRSMALALSCSPPAATFVYPTGRGRRSSPRLCPMRVRSCDLGLVRLWNPARTATVAAGSDAWFVSRYIRCRFHFTTYSICPGRPGNLGARRQWLCAHTLLLLSFCPVCSRRVLLVLLDVLFPAGASCLVHCVYVARIFVSA